ncbi:MAG: sodium/solute symporter [Verrucomicrobia bacterium]|nr:sodium/solute symporter [Verrucomicrobiota bacterium]
MLATTDGIIIAVYLCITIGLGLYFARRWKGTEDYFLAGRSLTWPLIGLSLFATNISTEHFVGLAAGGNKEGLVQGGYEWIASYCLLMLAGVFAPQYLRHKVYTIPEFFEKRYGIETRVLLTFYFLAMIVLTKTCVALYSGSRVLSDLTGWDFQAVMWGIGIITALYTMAGGLAAVVYTDAMQAIVLMGGAMLLTGMALNEVGWWSGLTERLQDLGKTDLLSMVKGPESDLPFSGFLLGNFLIGGMFYWCMDQVNVQRVLGAKNVREARLGAVFAAFLKIIPVFILVLPGVIAAALQLDIRGGDGQPDYNRTYSALVQTLLPVGIKGLVLAALLAALMSSVSSMFNSASTIVARDLIARFRPESSAKMQIVAGQIALVVVMVGGILTTPLIGKFPHLWGYLQEITGYLSVPFAVVGLSGVFIRRANRSGAVAAVIVGTIVSVLLLVDGHVEGGLLTALRHPYLNSFLHRTFLCAVITFTALMITSLMTSPPKDEVLAGTFSFAWVHGDGESPRDLKLAGFWMAVVFIIVTVLWWVFR